MRNFFYRMMDKFSQFMQGRNGPDDIYKFLFVIWIILFILNLVFRSYILSIIILLVVVYSVFRVLSKNVTKRRAENAKFLNIKNSIIEWFKYQRDRIRDIKIKRYRRCPNCKVALRLPIKKGKHIVVCPRCKNEFKVHIYF